MYWRLTPAVTWPAFSCPVSSIAPITIPPRRTAAYADGIRFDFACGDEVYGNCTQLCEFFETRGQAYVLRVPSNFTLTLAAGTKLTCAQAVRRLLKDKRRWEIRSAGHGLGHG